MEFLKIGSQILGVVIQCATIVTLIYALGKFLGKPNVKQNERMDKQDKRIDKIEGDVKDINDRLDQGDKHFTEVDQGNKVMQKALLALIDHAIDDNHKDKLIEAKDVLQAYLIDK